jgi:uncharacterized protein YbjT (DUF2867 family)
MYRPAHPGMKRNHFLAETYNSCQQQLNTFAASLKQINMEKILVLGATGKTGKRVVERLEKSGHTIRSGSRNAAIPFDWHKPETWAPVLHGIDKVYITFQPDLAVPGSIEAITAFIEEAKKATISKLVLLSGRGETEAQLCEEAVIGSGIDWTIVRASWFMQNFSESFILDSILAGHVILPIVKAKEPFVDADDIADVVVESLLDKKHSQKVYELTGPELLAYSDAVSRIAQKTGRKISYQEVPMDEYAAMMKEYQVPEDIIWLISYLFTEVLDGRNESVTNDIEFVLKRKATSFTEYIEKTAMSGHWKI